MCSEEKKRMRVSWRRKGSTGARGGSKCARTRPSVPTQELIYEFDLGPVGDDAGAVAFVEEQLDGAAAVFAVVECAFVHVHADELVSKPGLKIASKLHGVLKS